MSYIRISNNDGTYSLVHADDEGAYLAHHGVKGQRWGVRRFQNPDGSLTEKGKRRIKTLQGKSDKLDAKKAKLNSPKNMDNSKLANRSKDRGELIRRMQQEQQQELQRIQMQMQQDQQQQQQLQQLINNYNATPMFF